MQEHEQFTQLPEAMELADIGPYLQSLREHYRLSVADVAARLHVRTKYIEAIESSQFDTLPSVVYARGYVANYAEFLGVNPKQVVEKCFGDKPEKKDNFFIPKPSQRAPRPPIKLWFTAALALMIGVAAYDYITAPAAPEAKKAVAQARVSAVPEDILHDTRKLIMPVAGQKHCLLEGRALYCMAAYMSQNSAPSISLVERKFFAFYRKEN